jgi:hypothetical protein
MPVPLSFIAQIPCGAQKYVFGKMDGDHSGMEKIFLILGTVSP